jgi:excisionase family DNA binding protein
MRQISNQQNHGSRNVRNGSRREDPLSKKSIVPSQSEPLLLDIHGAARMLSATPWTVRSLLWDGKISYIKIGRKHLISPDDLRAYIASQKLKMVQTPALSPKERA